MTLTNDQVTIILNNKINRYIKKKEFFDTDNMNFKIESYHTKTRFKAAHELMLQTKTSLNMGSDTKLSRQLKLVNIESEASDGEMDLIVTSALEPR